VIAKNPLTAAASLGNVTYAANLSCGECVMGNYVYCVNGPENFTGPVPLKAVCCSNATNCPQAKNSSWTCSNKYADKTKTEQLRVCPYDANCGSQLLQIDGDDSQCIRLKTLKKGTTCVYRVQSKCNTPNLKLNGTESLVVPEMVLLSNVTIPEITQQSCSEVRSQQCLCRNITANNMTK